MHAERRFLPCSALRSLLAVSQREREREIARGERQRMGNVLPVNWRNSRQRARESKSQRGKWFLDFWKKKPTVVFKFCSNVLWEVKVVKCCLSGRSSLYFVSLFPCLCPYLSLFLSLLSLSVCLSVSPPYLSMVLALCLSLADFRGVVIYAVVWIVSFRFSLSLISYLTRVAVNISTTHVGQSAPAFSARLIFWGEAFFSSGEICLLSVVMLHE